MLYKKSILNVDDFKQYKTSSTGQPRRLVTCCLANSLWVHDVRGRLKPSSKWGKQLLSNKEREISISVISIQAAKSFPNGAYETIGELYSYNWLVEIRGI